MLTPPETLLTPPKSKILENTLAVIVAVCLPCSARTIEIKVSYSTVYSELREYTRVIHCRPCCNFILFHGVINKLQSILCRPLC